MVDRVVGVVVDERAVLELFDPLARGGVEADREVRAAGPADGDAVAVGDDPAGALLDGNEASGVVALHDAAHEGMVEAEDVRAGRKAGGGQLEDFHAPDGGPRHEGRAAERDGKRHAAVRDERPFRAEARRTEQIVVGRRGECDEGEKREDAETGGRERFRFHVTSPPGAWSRDWNGRRRSGDRPGTPGSSGRSAWRSRRDGGTATASGRRAKDPRRNGSAKA